MITNPEFSFHTVNLAVGAELSLPISYCDALGIGNSVKLTIIGALCFRFSLFIFCIWPGNHFYEAHNAILFDVVTNYPDVVSINKSYNGNGEIKLKVWKNVN